MAISQNLSLTPGAEIRLIRNGVIKKDGDIIMAHIWKRSRGSYGIRISVMRSGKLYQHAFTFTPETGSTEEEIQKQLNEFVSELEASIKSGASIPAPGKSALLRNQFMKLEDFIHDEYYSYIERSMSPNTVRNYVAICESTIIPSFGNIALGAITHQHLQAFIDYFAYDVIRKDGSGKKGLDAATAKRYATTFRSIMTHACRCGYIDNNPFANRVTVYPKKQRKERDIYTVEEAQQYIEALENEPLMNRLLLSIGLCTGMRRAEIIALRWSDINFDELYVDVNKSAVKLKGEKQTTKTPKSQRSNRKVWFTAEYKDLLSDWKSEQAKLGQVSDEGYIFTNSNGTMLSIYTVGRLCGKFEARHNLRHITLHGLRHTFASLLVSNGVDLETVKDLLGHESIRTTSIYLHAYDGKKREAANVIGELYAGKI